MMDWMLDDLKRMDKRQILYQGLSFGMIVSSALMIWKVRQQPQKPKTVIFSQV